jgi:hypothetical protein
MGPLRTVAKLPPAQVSSGVSLNLRFHPRLVASENGLRTFAAMIRTYFAQGGMHVQPNVVSTETLRDAQEHPLPRRVPVRLMPFHRLAVAKQNLFGRRYPYVRVIPQSSAEMAGRAQLLRDAGLVLRH